MASQYRTRGYKPGEIVHLTCRGFRRERIFLDAGDHEEFMESFHSFNAALPPEDRLSLHANAHMPNHQHLMVRNGRSPDAITSVMHKTCTSYAADFNWRQGRKGQVFERPFRGRVMRTPEHIVNAFAYIHQNPDSSLRLDNSSHGVYAGLRNDPRIDTSLAWRVFGGREGYLKFFDDSAQVRNARLTARRRYYG